LNRRGFLKVFALVPLFPPLRTAMALSRGGMKIVAQGDPFKNARRILLTSERFPYERYRKVMAVEKKIRDGKRFMLKHADGLAAAEARYGVDRHYIAAIIGAESDYGRNPGKYNPVGVFVTMIEKITRKKSFGEFQLVELLRFCQKYNFDPHSLKGSYSGAIGIAQFIPSLLNKLYVDADGDGKPNPGTVADGIHSVANYLKNYRGYGSGWSLGIKASPGNKNWRALLAYNRHPNYARAVSEIAEGIRQ
jgi:membrane-bound lytic murein transglycosylase B